jgi:hypothetical protein
MLFENFSSWFLKLLVFISSKIEKIIRPNIYSNIKVKSISKSKEGKGVRHLRQKILFKAMQSIPDKYSVEEDDEADHDFELCFDMLGSPKKIKVNEYEQCLKIIGCIAHNYPIKIMSHRFQIDKWITKSNIFMFMLEEKPNATYYENSYIESYLKEKWLPETLSALNEELDLSDDYCIDNFDSETIADICWTTIIEYLLDTSILTENVLETRYPTVFSYYLQAEEEFMSE